MEGHNWPEPGENQLGRADSQPPYFGYPLKPGITFTYMGVAVNDGPAS